jgi:hypothetical protein
MMPKAAMMIAGPKPPKLSDCASASPPNAMD